ncbi:efflux RND transporter periplasmic adaptor subunit [Spirulina subsalsa]|uniref:efflux RND transporter periplasmic adaptor subunit n=1 Tax=Spirulina subsalsa TaxID=54311 RepID=UPI000371E207|nr:efflux RND transporter periplasmic adaptor subunit [Spirulina subsalsa]
MRSSPSVSRLLTGSLLGLMVLSLPTLGVAHVGHDHGAEFQSGTSQPASGVRVDNVTAERLGIQMEPVGRRSLNVGIRTTGEVVTQPDQMVMVNAPINGTVMELLVQPGDRVRKGQALARIIAPELIELRVSSQSNRVGVEAELRAAQANLTLARRNYERQVAMAEAEITAAQQQMNQAQERFRQDQFLAEAGAIARQQLLDSESHLATIRSQLTRAESRQAVLEAQAELERSQVAVEAAQSRLQLSSATYQARLQQLNSTATEQGLVTISAPIAGQVAERPVTLGEAVEAATTPIVSIVNGDRLRITANVHEKDLAQVVKGQSVRARVNSLPDRIFTGRVVTIGAKVDGETRVIPVTAELENAAPLKPGMFAELEILTARTPERVLTIPASALVDADGRHLVFVQNGSAFEPVEINIGRRDGNQVEIESGLFEGDYVVVQGALQLYAQSLLGGGKTQPSAEAELDAPENAPSVPNWGWGLGGLAIALIAFSLGRRSRPEVMGLNHYPLDPAPDLALTTSHHEAIPTEVDYNRS